MAQNTLDRYKPFVLLPRAGEERKELTVVTACSNVHPITMTRTIANLAEDLACTAVDIAVTVFGADFTNSGVTHRPVRMLRTISATEYTDDVNGELRGINRKPRFSQKLA